MADSAAPADAVAAPPAAAAPPSVKDMLKPFADKAGEKFLAGPDVRHGVAVHPGVAAMVDFMMSMPTPVDLPGVSPEDSALQFRGIIDMMCGMMGWPLDPYVQVEEVDAGGVKAYYFVWPSERNNGNRAAPTLLYLHGGAYVGGGAKSTHGGTCGEIAKMTGLRVLSVEYRLVPEHTQLDAIDDAHAAYRWLVDVAKVPPRNIGVAGDSAGGGLAAILVQRLVARGEAVPGALALMSPLTDCELNKEHLNPEDHDDPNFRDPKPRAEVMSKLEPTLKGRDPRDPTLSPLFGSFAGFCPTFVGVAGREGMNKQAFATFEKLKAAGVSDCRLVAWPNAIHIFPCVAMLPGADHALAQLAFWVADRIAPDIANRT